VDRQGGETQEGVSEEERPVFKNRVRQYAVFLHQEMCQAKERFKVKLGAARQKSWEKFAENDLKRNPWGVVYKLAAEKFHRAGVLSCFARKDGTITLTQEETMTHLVVNLLPDDNPETNDHMQKIEQRNYNTIVPIGHDDDLVEAEELATIVASLKNNKAPGLDTINGRTVKMTHQWVGPALLRIYNACWHLGYFPKAWKKGKLVILLKDPTGDQSSIKNYRPIVLLPVYGKILEKLLVLAGLLPVDLEIEKANCLRELRNGRGAHFQNEHIAPDTPRHRILHCPRYLMAQEAINEELRSWPPSMQEVPFLEDETIFDLLISQNPSTEST
jgi:hypothetical protein